MVTSPKPTRKYRSPPVIEALCEIFFAGSVWDPTIWGKFHARIEADFPKKREQHLQEASIDLDRQSGGAVVGMRPVPRMQFLSAAEDRIVQIGPDTLVVNQLRPYPQFSDWEPVVLRMCETYRELARPSECVRLGVRYINRIELPPGRLNIADYFNVGPGVPKSLGDRFGPFLLRLVLPRGPQHDVTLSLSTPLDANKAAPTFILDLYAILATPEAKAFETLPAAIRSAQRSVEEVFEASITDELRALFDQEI